MREKERERERMKEREREREEKQSENGSIFNSNAERVKRTLSTVRC